MVRPQGALGVLLVSSGGIKDGTLAHINSSPVAQGWGAQNTGPFTAGVPSALVEAYVSGPVTFCMVDGPAALSFVPIRTPLPSARLARSTPLSG